MLTYGFSDKARLRGNILRTGTSSRFEVFLDGAFLAEMRLNHPGRHNVQNALGALGVALEAGVHTDTVAEAFAKFGGVGRRFEIKGEAGGVTVVDDYGHHPVEIRATLATARTCFPDKRLVVVFQPHRFTRTKALFGEFCRCFEGVDELLLTEIYPASESPIPGVSGESLARGITQVSKTRVSFFPDFASVEAALPESWARGSACDPGGGNVWQVGQHYLERAVTLEILEDGPGESDHAQWAGRPRPKSARSLDDLEGLSDAWRVSGRPLALGGGSKPLPPTAASVWSWSLLPGWRTGDRPGAPDGHVRVSVPGGFALQRRWPVRAARSGGLAEIRYPGDRGRGRGRQRRSYGRTWRRARRRMAFTAGSGVGSSAREFSTGYRVFARRVEGFFMIAGSLSIFRLHRRGRTGRGPDRPGEKEGHPAHYGGHGGMRVQEPQANAGRLLDLADSGRSWGHGIFRDARQFSGQSRGARAGRPLNDRGGAGGCFCRFGQKLELEVRVAS